MATSGNRPKNLNYFIPTGFNFSIDKIPHVNFFCQSANLPGISMGTPIVTNPLRDFPVSGDKAQFNELRVRFIVDEELQNWLEIYNWIVGLTYPKNQDQYIKLANKNNFKPFGDRYSDGNLFVLTSHKNVQYWIRRTCVVSMYLT